MQCKSGGEKHGTNRHKAYYITLQKLSAKSYHTVEGLTKTNLNFCKICVSLTTSQKEQV
jgi:hypothetical protein